MNCFLEAALEPIHPRKRRCRWSHEQRCWLPVVVLPMGFFPLVQPLYQPLVTV